MVRWKVYVGSKQRGGDYDSEKRAIVFGEAVARGNKQVYVYKVVNDGGPQQVARWINGFRVA